MKCLTSFLRYQFTLRVHQTATLFFSLVTFRACAKDMRLNCSKRHHQFAYTTLPAFHERWTKSKKNKKKKRKIEYVASGVNNVLCKENFNPISCFLSPPETCEMYQLIKGAQQKTTFLVSWYFAEDASCVLHEVHIKPAQRSANEKIYKFIKKRVWKTQSLKKLHFCLYFVLHSSKGFYLTQ